MKSKSYTIQFEKSFNKQHFWRIVHRNKQEIARSSETYTRRVDCKRALNNMIEKIKKNDYYVMGER